MVEIGEQPVLSNQRQCQLPSVKRGVANAPHRLSSNESDTTVGVLAEGAYVVAARSGVHHRQGFPLHGSAALPGLDLTRAAGQRNSECMAWDAQYSTSHRPPRYRTPRLEEHRVPTIHAPAFAHISNDDSEDFSWGCRRSRSFRPSSPTSFARNAQQPASAGQPMVQGRRASLELAAKAYLGGALTADADFGIHAHQHMGRHQAALHHADGSQGPAIHPQSSSDHLQQQLQLHAATMARAAVASQPGELLPHQHVVSLRLNLF